MTRRFSGSFILSIVGVYYSKESTTPMPKKPIRPEYGDATPEDLARARVNTNAE